MIIYRQHEQPGCGGCLLIGLLLLLLLGGMPLVFKVLGTLLFVGLFLVLLTAAAIAGFSYYVKQQVSRYEQSQTEAHNVFVSLLVHILIKIAELDNEVTREEIHTITNFFRVNLRYSHTQLLWVKELIKEARQTQYSLDDLLQEFKQRHAYEPRLILVELVYQVLFTKVSVNSSELGVAERIASFLGISQYDQQAIKYKYIHRQRQAAADEERYYDILGLQAGASFEEIKSAYRKLSQQYHPDKVGHLGEEFRNVAEEKMKEINIAYHFLKKKFAA